MSGSLESLMSVCEALSNEGPEVARALASARLPFESIPKRTRGNTPEEALRVFARDGFIDRYGGDRLVFPGVLRVLSIELPAEFPYHPNWKRDRTHLVYWRLTPTVDHVVPVTSGGADHDSNWVTTSMMRNAAKSVWSLEELGWRLHPPGDLRAWDGLSSWFRSRLSMNGRLRDNIAVRQWARLLEKVLPGGLGKAG